MTLQDELTQEARRTRTHHIASVLETRRQAVENWFSINRHSVAAFGIDQHLGYGHYFDIEVESLDTGIRYPKTRLFVWMSREIQYPHQLEPLERIRVTISNPNRDS